MFLESGWIVKGLTQILATHFSVRHSLQYSFIPACCLLNTTMLPKKKETFFLLCQMHLLWWCSMYFFLVNLKFNFCFSWCLYHYLYLFSLIDPLKIFLFNQTFIDFAFTLYSYFYLFVCLFWIRMTVTENLVLCFPVLNSIIIPRYK